ncbi:MAG: hypothetical protein ACE5OZ_25600 [Candidatus Heimdallarchaeota archaeon]
MRESFLKKPFWISLKLYDVRVQFIILVIWNLQFVIFLYQFDHLEPNSGEPLNAMDIAFETWMIYWQLFISVLIVFGMFCGKYVRREIAQLYGIDPVHPNEDDDSAALQHLFRKSEYAAYKDIIRKYLSSPWHNAFALAVVAGLGVLAGYVIQQVYWEEVRFPIWDIQPTIFESFLIGVSWLICGILILEWISAFSTLLALALSYWRLSDYPEISDLSVSKFLNREDTGKNGKPPFQEACFSPQWFKKHCMKVPSFLFPITLIIFIILAIFSVLVFQLLLNISKTETNIPFTKRTIPILVIGFAVIIIVLLALNFALVIGPQISLRKIMGAKHTELVDILEKDYEAKKLQWLRLTHAQKLTGQQKLAMQLDVLSLMLSDLKEVSLWAFDLKRIFSFLGTFLIPIAALVLQIYFSTNLR